MNAVEEKVAPVLEAEAEAVDAGGAWPSRSLDALREAGLLALTVPVEAGGKGATMRDFA
ncbi:MAG: acyl-CoA dehydrogenase, partial [Acidobacteria bacterium]